jgi:nucleoside-diphosphate-sugar epimerase
MIPSGQSREHSMTVLVTGGAGFVLSNLVNRLLERVPAAKVIVLDTAESNCFARDFFHQTSDRLMLVEGDVRSRSLLDEISTASQPTHVIHAATVTHTSEWEQEDPARFIDVNVMGTVNLLEWARRLPALSLFLYVSSGAVYGNPTTHSPVGLQPETGPFNPPELYAISKYCSELIVRRYATLFGLRACCVRFPDVFGPMERPTPGRITMSLPFKMMRSVVERRPLRVSQRSIEAGGDFINAEDVAEAVLHVITSELLPHDVFNVGSGSYTTIRHLFDTFQTVATDFTYELVDEHHAEVVLDPTQRLARYNAYSIERINELGWQPRPLTEQLRTYFEWVMTDPEGRCPA